MNAYKAGCLNFSFLIFRGRPEGSQAGMVYGVERHTNDVPSQKSNAILEHEKSTKGRYKLCKRNSEYHNETMQHKLSKL